jgi:hypothetical protein
MVNDKSLNYRKAQRIRNYTLRELIKDNFNAGEDVKESITKSLGDLVQANIVGLKEKFDPVNIAKKLTGNLGAYAVGRVLGRSSEDIKYFTGIGRRKTASPASREGGSIDKKISDLQTASHTTVSEGRQQRFRKGDGSATLLARMLNLMKKYHDEDLQRYELERNREKDTQSKREEYNKKLAKMMGASTGRAPAGNGGQNEDGSGGSGLMSKIIGTYAGAKISRWILSKLLKTKWGKALAKTKMGRFLVQKSLGLLKPFKGSPLNVAKNLVTAPFKSITKFLTPSAKVAETGAKGVASASKVVKAIPKPGFLMTAEEKIAERGARMATEKAAGTAVGTVAEKATPKIVEQAGKEAAKGAGAAGKAIATTGEAAAKITGKKIPVIGAVLGGVFAVQRAMEGDYLGAGGELLSGLASTIPGFGTAASLAIDGALLARDLEKESKSETPVPVMNTGRTGGPNNQGLKPGPTATPAPKTTPATATTPATPPKVNYTTGPKGSKLGPQGQDAVKDPVTGKMGYMSGARGQIKGSFVPFTETPTAVPEPATPNAASVKMQEAIKENQTEKLNENSAPMKPIIIDNSKKINKNIGGANSVDYGGDFNVRETDPTLLWVSRSNFRPI